MRAFLPFIVATLISLPALAGSEFRLSAGIHEVKAEEMNEFFTDQDLKELKKIPGFKIDLTWGPASWIYLGLRLSQNRIHLGDETVQTGPDQNFSKLIYEYYAPILRLYLINARFFRFDIFGGAGGTRVIVQSKKDSLEQTQVIPDNDLRFMQFAGGSISMGAGRFMVVAEGGFEWTRVRSLTYSANANPRIGLVDLNGPYVGVGISTRLP